MLQGRSELYAALAAPRPARVVVLSCSFTPHRVAVVEPSPWPRLRSGTPLQSVSYIGGVIALLCDTTPEDVT